MSGAPETLPAAGLDCVTRRWMPVKLEKESKKPVAPGWQSQPPALPDLLQHLDNGGNLGVVLGKQSGGLVDVDGDTPEAVAVMPEFLPATDLRHGRPSNPGSHAWYRGVDDVPAKKYFGLDHEVLIEVRSDGGQTVLPPSIHPDGEKYEWEEYGDGSLVTAAELHQAVGKVAACAVLASAWPENGQRHDLSLAVTGFLLRAGIQAGDVEKIVANAARAAGDEEWKARGRQNVESTAAKIKAGHPATGGKMIKALLGEETGNALLDKLREFLQLPETDPLDERPANISEHGEIIPLDMPLVYLIDDIADEYLREIEGAPPRVTVTPWQSLNTALGGGLYPGELTVVGAQPGGGKSLIAKQLARFAADNGMSALLVSREMSYREVMNRLVCEEGLISPLKLKAHALSPADLINVRGAVKRLRAMPLTVTDRIVTLEELEARVRQDRPDIVLVHYLQMLRLKSRSRDRRGEVEQISQSLKALALDLGIPIIALSSLSRRERVNGKLIKPAMDHLRESGQIEHDADNILLLHRESDTTRTVECAVAKARNGIVTTFDLTLNANTLTLEERA